MVKQYTGEVWKPVIFTDLPQVDYYQVSNYGRVKSFKADKKEGRVLKHSSVGGYPAISIRKADKKTTPQCYTVRL